MKIQNNSYAMVELGRIKKNAKFINRDLKKAVQYFAVAAKEENPQGYYYLGKEYFYGQALRERFCKATV